MDAQFDTGNNFTSAAIQRAQAGEVVASWVEPDLLREAQDLLRSEQTPAPTTADIQAA